MNLVFFRRHLHFIPLIFFVSLFLSLDAKLLPCEFIANVNKTRNAFLNTKTCFMNGTTKIKSKNAELELRDVSVKKLDFFNNRNVEYLPIYVDKSFPELLVYEAASCSLSKLFYDNFVGLSKLQWLFLNGNNIEKIFSDTFKDLKSLTHVYLCKFLNFLHLLEKAKRTFFIKITID